MDALMQSSLLLGAFISFASARVGAEMLGRIGSGAIGWLRLSLGISLLFFIGLGLHMLLAVVFTPEAGLIRPLNVLILGACIGLILAALRTAKQVQRKIADKEEAEAAKKGS